MTIEFRTILDDYIKQWPNWSGIIPVIGDIVVLHFGDYNEISEYYEVKKRKIDGTNSDKIIILVEKF